MKHSSIFLIALATLVVFQTSNVLAQYSLRARFHLTATVLEPSSDSTPRTFREKTFKIDNVKLLEILGAATTNDFTGADLVINRTTDDFLVMKGTNLLANVSVLLTRQSDGIFVVRGKQASDFTFDLQRKSVDQYRFMYGNGENSFAFSALERTRLKWKSTDKQPQQRYLENAHCYGFGDGYWAGRPAVFTGTIELAAVLFQDASTHATPGAAVSPILLTK